MKKHDDLLSSLPPLPFPWYFVLYSHYPFSLDDISCIIIACCIIRIGTHFLIFATTTTTTTPTTTTSIGSSPSLAPKPILPTSIKEQSHADENANDNANNFSNGEIFFNLVHKLFGHSSDILYSCLAIISLQTVGTIATNVPDGRCSMLLCCEKEESDVWKKWRR